MPTDWRLLPRRWLRLSETPEAARGRSMITLEDAFKHPIRDVERVVDDQGRVSYRYTGENATVVLNEQGQVVTGWGINSGGTAGGTGG
jgi:hypothetical protein